MTESISAIIVVGFSVDYVCHLAHTYAESTAATRAEKTADALRIMGATVAAGGVTTLGAGIFMFPCQMTFFTKMATLITMTITLSLAFALMFFMALCVVFGPQSNVTNTHYDLSEE